jgi:hypothetical protein
MKKLVLTILITLSTFLFLEISVVAESSSNLLVRNHIHDENVILINQEVTASNKDVITLAKSGKFIYAYSTNKYVFDYYSNEYLDDVYAISYYYDENSIFTIEKLIFPDSTLSYSNRKDSKLNEHLMNSYNRFNEKEKLEPTESSTTKAEVITDLDASLDNNFEIPRVKYKDTVIEQDMKGYFIYTSFLYRYFLDDVTLYRVDSAVQFTSGSSAASYENFDDRYEAYEGAISATLTKNVQYGYGIWYSNQPYLLDYYPHTTPVYRTITSGITLGLTLGQTQSATASGGTNTGASATSEFSSSFNIQYFYQATSEFASPLLSSGEVSSGQGCFWNLTQWGPDRSITVFPGTLIEVIPADNNARFDGNYNLNIDFTVRKPFLWFYNDYTSFGYSTVIYLDNRI